MLFGRSKANLLNVCIILSALAITALSRRGGMVALSLATHEQFCVVQEPHAALLDFRRQAVISLHAPIDVTGSVLQVQINPTDMQHDLLTTLNMTKVGTFITQMAKSHALYWQCNVASNISYTFSTYEHKLEIDPALQDFIDNDVNFEITHADGSFKTHNLFCATYCRVHMPQHSWRVLYIHSIMGTGTNYFPMNTSQIPKLKALLTPYEMMHVEAFPSLLRATTSIFSFLFANEHRLTKITKIMLYRVIDNRKIYLSEHDLWVGLNYQLIHMMDFLPSTCRQNSGGFYMLVNFLRRHKKLFFQISAVHEFPAGPFANTCDSRYLIRDAMTPKVMFRNPGISHSAMTRMYILNRASAMIHHNNTFRVFFTDAD